MLGKCRAKPPLRLGGVQGAPLAEIRHVIVVGAAAAGGRRVVVEAGRIEPAKGLIAAGRLRGRHIVPKRPILSGGNDLERRRLAERIADVECTAVVGIEKVGHH